MLKLKEHITGFIYDSCNGEIEKIFLTPVKDTDIVLRSEDEMYIDNECVNDLFEIHSKEQLDNDEEGLNTVMEWVDEDK